MINYRDIIGVPFVEKGRSPETGWDCFGLLKWCMKEAYGIDIPEHMDDYSCVRDKDGAFRIIMAEAPRWRSLLKPEYGAVPVFSFVRAYHVGFFIDTYHFLHVYEGIQTSIADVNSLMWASRLRGVYKWATL